MVTVPVSKPARAKAIVLAAGVAAIVVAHFVPQYSLLLSQILNVLGIGALGVGGAQVVQAPKHGGP